MNDRLTPEQRTIATQRERIEELEEEVRQLRQSAQPTAVLPYEWKLEPSQRKLVLALAATPSGFLNYNALFQTINCFSTETEPRQLVAQQVHRARRKLGPYGVKLIVRWGEGVEMPAASRAIIKQALERSTLSHTQ